MIDKINLYISSKDMLCDDIFVYPQSGIIQKENGEYNQTYNEYIRNNKVYIVIDGIMYNKAKLIYDSYYRDSLPKKRYKVLVNDGDIAHPTINNIIMTDLRSTEPVVGTTDENVSILFDGIDTEINIEYLLQKLVSKEYKVEYNGD